MEFTVCQICITITNDNNASFSYGRSEGTPTEKGLRIDAQAALDYIKEDEVFKDTKLIIYGQSLGGAVAIDLVSRYEEQVDALIIENTFLSVPKLVPHLVPQLRYLTFLCFQIWPSDKSITKIKQTPILFLSGKKDEIIPQQHMKSLYELAKPTGGKEWKEFNELTRISKAAGRENERANTFRDARVIYFKCLIVVDKWSGMILWRVYCLRLKLYNRDIDSWALSLIGIIYFNIEILLEKPCPYIIHTDHQSKKLKIIDFSLFYGEAKDVAVVHGSFMCKEAKYDNIFTQRTSTFKRDIVKCHKEKDRKHQRAKQQFRSILTDQLFESDLKVIHQI
ncbi:10054_t:CDS:2, partial [Scutellospora calospora]